MERWAGISAMFILLHLFVTPYVVAVPVEGWNFTAMKYEAPELIRHQFYSWLRATSQQVVFNKEFEL